MHSNVFTYSVPNAAITRLKMRLDAKNFHMSYQKFLETGSVEDRICSGRLSAITDDIINEVEEALNKELQTSVRKIGREMNISKDKAHGIMRDIIRLKSYTMHCTQQLYEEDVDLRVEMSECLIPILKDPANKGNIFFSDESRFYVSGIGNKCNCRIWTANNPFITVEAAMNSFKINVWCAMSNKQIIGPYIFFEEDTINQQNYLNMLKNYFYPILQKKRLHKKIVFQQNGTLAHFSKAVRTWLNKNFNDKWIGRRGPICWVPRSRNLTPLDFCLWGCIKSNVYKTKVEDICELKNRTEKEIKVIKRQTLQNVLNDILKRLKFCINVNGNIFEQLMWNIFISNKT